jgi:2,3-bisphosphoglycerate-independent phosphoglycerate mutase
MKNKKVVLCILDGFGIGADYDFNAVTRARKPNIDKMFEKYGYSKLICSGFDVGLPMGTMGNSEVGHLNIGAGRIVYQDIARIHKSIEDAEFENNPVYCEILEKTIANGKKLHLLGLVSDGDVHSSMVHLKELVRTASLKGLSKIFIHAFTDGRDTPPESGIEYIGQIEDICSSYGARIASVSGRYYAMDRDNRWDRVEKAYKALVSPESGEGSLSACEIITRSYKNGVTDEFIIPTCVREAGKPVAKIEKGDSVVFFNFRADRARELSIALNALSEIPFETEQLDLNYITITEYREDFPFKVMFGKQHLSNILGEVISKKGLRQLRTAETEKYAHVTFFFNGGDEKKFEGEERILIPSPKVATYDMQPEMSSKELTDSLVGEIEKNIFDFVTVNYANCDMVGHTGDFNAAVKAVEAVDECVGRLIKACADNDYLLILTADHGNAEYMKDGDVPFTAHTKNMVPFLIAENGIELYDGKLGDIAPTVLELMNIAKPEEMTGISLIRRRNAYDRT